MTASIIAAAAVIVFLVIFIILGIYRGFLRIILTTFSLVITLVLAGALAPPLANFIENETSIGPKIQTKLESYAENYLASLPDTVQSAENAFIDALPLPVSMKADLKAGNTLAGYVDDGVSSFSEYISLHLTGLAISILSYIALFIVIYLLLRLLLALTRVINHVPVLGGINRFFGAIIGFAEGVLFLWIVCMVIMMLSGTDFGIACEKVIQGSKVLTFIYEHNYLTVIINGIIGIFR